MRVCITTEQRFQRTPDGVVWTTSAMPYGFWRRYLSVFDEVQVIARIGPASQAEKSWTRVDGDRVRLVGIPYYVGLWQYLRRARSVRVAVQTSVNQKDALIMRVSSLLAGSLMPLLRHGRPFGLEVVGDPYEALGSIRHPLGPLLRHWFKLQLKRQCQRASAIAYVTRAALQRRYQPAPKTFTTHYSSIELSDAAFAKAPKAYSTVSGTLRVLSVGAMDQPYKGYDVLIDAVSICRRGGLQLDLILVGEGRCRESLEQQAAARGISTNVTFTGALPCGSSVRDELDRADLFVLASRTEGLPRAMIEAMARGLPCLGSAVGGIPELLPAEEMVPCGDARALAAKISGVLRNPERLSRMAERNLETARAYHDCVLESRRNEFLAHLYRATKKWRDMEVTSSRY